MSRKDLPRATPQLIVRPVQRLERRVVTGGAPALRHVDRRQPSPQRLADEALRHNSRVHDEHLRRVQRCAREAPLGPTGTRSAGDRCGVPGPRAAGEAHPRGPLATAAGACAKPPAARGPKSTAVSADGSKPAARYLPLLRAIESRVPGSRRRRFECEGRPFIARRPLCGKPGTRGFRHAPCHRR